VRKVILLAALAAALVLVLSASALTVTGRTVGANGVTPIPSALVHIYNESTGASGSTYSDGSGYYSFGNIASGTTYDYWAEKCYLHAYLLSHIVKELGSLGAPWLSMPQVLSC
jgi:hypothetical protein